MLVTPKVDVDDGELSDIELGEDSPVDGLLSDDIDDSLRLESDE